MNGYGAVSPICIYCDMIRYLTQNKSPSVKKGFMSIIEGFPHVGVERFELPTPCSQSMGQLSVLPSIKWLFFVVTSTETVAIKQGVKNKFIYIYQKALQAQPGP